MTGGIAAVEALVEAGIDVAFTVSGESFLEVLEGLRRRQNAIRLVTCRHEGGAAFAAEAFGKLTGRPAAVFVSRGPGATNAAIGVHTARQDSTPLLLFVGHVKSHSRGTEAFQEIDQRAMFEPVAKAVFEPATPAAIYETVSQAARLAIEGRPGPVVVVLPRDFTEAAVAEVVPDGDTVEPTRESVDVAPALALIRDASRPLVIAGELIATEGAHGALAAFADALGAPVMAAYRRQDVIDNQHSAYAGHLEINRVGFQLDALAEADLLIAAGCRMDGITGADGALPAPGQKLLVLHPEAAVLDRLGADGALRAGAETGLRALVVGLGGHISDPALRAWRDGLHKAYLDFSDPAGSTAKGAVDLGAVVAEVGRATGGDAIVLTDGGSFARWVHRFHRFRRPASQAGPMAGAMGYAVPGALGARLAFPERPVVAFVGDGGFLMTGQELVTAVEQNLAVTIILCDNGAHGSILQGQERRFGAAAIYGTRLASPDFAAMARAMGVTAWRIDKNADFAPAFAAALEVDGPRLLHLITDLRDIVPFDGGPEAV